MPSTDPWPQLGKHSATCICRRCRNERRRAAWRPAPAERVLSDEVSRHIKLLVRMGWTQTQIAKVAGVSTGAISTAKEPGVVINVETAEKILAVKPTQSRVR
jgi:hypothetical protein